MDIRSLTYFIAVAEEQSVGRAAVRLHITQPALTRQIQLLEEDIGQQLFRRTTSGVEITAAGSALLNHARNIKIELAQAKLAARQAETLAYQELNIGVYGSAIFSIVPQVLKRFAEIHPRVNFVLHNARKDQQVELLREGKILFAFDRFPLQEADLAYETVYRETLQVALHKDHPLAARSVIYKDDLEGEPQIGANFDSAMAAGLNQAYCSQAHARHRADDMLTTLALVSNGFGITFAPPSINALQIPNVVFRPYADGPMIPFDVQCIYRHSESSPLLHAMLATVRAFCAEQLASAAAVSV
ncbi:LysR substrate-binding domain-containing protein [Uliginosibacterium sp. H3]|uniref:LysR substrate-binding domain-containing protein n=1 Tax=Uliginosibacterium silvisoli TaxID=3114758 RepID=A0ABU6K760_9RHOO|nr:LysR substrate-binding domain-containing protein [Uliginosibacterium sp. H3]